MVKRQILFFALIICFFGTMAFGQVSTTKWVCTNTWHGHGSMLTPVIKLYSESWRISCKLAKQSIISIRVLDVTGKMVEKHSDNVPTTGFTTWTKKGNCERILQITCPNTDWNVFVEQYMDLSEEWQFRIESKKKSWNCIKAWGGTGNETFQYSAKNEECRLNFVQQNEGELTVKITDEKGNYVFGNISRKDGNVYTTCLFKEGTYTIEISGDTDWYVDAAVKAVNE